MPPRNPNAALPVACAVRPAVIAAINIIPSMPRLMMPLRWTTSSPSTARSSGVAARSASGSELPIKSTTSSNMFESDEHENHDGLSERGHGGGDVRGALQLARSGDERAEEERRRERSEGMELCEQRHGDAGVAVACSEALEETIRDAEELDAAGQSGGGAGDGHRPHELR